MHTRPEHRLRTERRTPNEPRLDLNYALSGTQKHHITPGRLLSIALLPDASYQEYLRHQSPGGLRPQCSPLASEGRKLAEAVLQQPLDGSTGSGRS